MPTVTTASEVTKPKAQPWRAVWPAPEPGSNSQLGRKTADHGSGSGAYGYNDKDEGIAPK
jgi:hypothetical protein